MEFLVYIFVGISLHVCEITSTVNRMQCFNEVLIVIHYFTMEPYFFLSSCFIYGFQKIMNLIYILWSIYTYLLNLQAEEKVISINSLILYVFAICTLRCHRRFA